MATLCFCPPDSWENPVPSPSTVSYPSGRPIMKEWALAALALCTISAREISLYALAPYAGQNKKFIGEKVVSNVRKRVSDIIWEDITARHDMT